MAYYKGRVGYEVRVSSGKICNKKGSVDNVASDYEEFKYTYPR